MRHLVIASLLLLCPALALTDDHGLLLVPINPGVVRGASGASWTTTLWATNFSDFDAMIDCTSVAVDLPCTVIKARTSTPVTNLPYLNSTHNGFFLSVTNRAGTAPFDALSFQARTFDSSQTSADTGTELPLPSPQEFHGGTVVLAPVPANAHSRGLLRIYGLNNGVVTVTISRFESR